MPLVGALGGALIGGFTTFVGAWYAWRNERRSEDRRWAREDRDRHIDRLVETYATFAKSGWDWTIERWVLLHADEPNPPPNPAESTLKDKFETAYGLIRLLAPEAVVKAADEYDQAIGEVMRWIPGHGIPPELDEQTDAVRDRYADFIAVSRQELNLPYGIPVLLPGGPASPGTDWHPN